eukprot:6211059-Pleurochrysis_carterae.AAC.3
MGVYVSVYATCNRCRRPRPAGRWGRDSLEVCCVCRRVRRGQLRRVAIPRRDDTSAAAGRGGGHAAALRVGRRRA